MIKRMTLVRPALCAVLLCGVSAISALAQDPASPVPGSPGPLIALPPPAAQAHHGPPPNPLFDALDTNHDGVISAEEIANASASLKALLKNGSDHLTREDLRPAGAPPPPPRPAAADAPGNPAPGEAAPPRPKIGAIRPHNPPPLWQEEDTADAGAPHMRPPGPDREQAGEDLDRPHFQRPWMREHERMRRMQEEEMADARPFPRHERVSRRQEPARAEDADQADDDVRPPRPDAMRDDREARPRHAPPYDAGSPDDARPRPHGPMNEEAGPRPAQQHQGPPRMALFDTLDTNHDGVISAEEIANAPAALKALLKNGSDHLTRDDLRPPGPPPQAAR